MERNISLNILHSDYIFKQDLKSRLLKMYIERKCSILQEQFTLYDILKILKCIFQNYNLLDQCNDLIVLCDQELELAIDMSMISLCQLPALVLKSLKKISFHTTIPPELSYDLEIMFEKKIVIHNLPEYKSWKFLIKTEFRNLLERVDTFDKYRTIFTFDEIVYCFHKYLESRNETIFIDVRNNKIVNISKDDLSHVFKVNALHKKQIPIFINKQIDHIIIQENDISSSSTN